MRTFLGVWNIAGRYREYRDAQYALGMLLLADGVLDSRPRMLPGVVALVAGIVLFLIVGSALETVPNSKSATGRIITLDRGKCSVSVAYRAEGRIFQTSVQGDEFCSADVGRSVEVRYNAFDPSEATVGDRGWFVVVFPLLFLLLGAGIFLSRLCGVLLGFFLLLRGRRAEPLSPAAESACREAEALLRGSSGEPEPPVFQPR